MAGYNWNSGKSNNAVTAEGRGLMVASAFAKWARRWFPGCTAADVRDALPRSEWHHSSKFFNQVNYYDPRDLRQECLRYELRTAIAERKAADALHSRAVKAGITHILLISGERWHPLPSRDELRVSDVYRARVENQLAHGHGEVTI